MVVGIGNDGLSTLDAGPEVIFNNVPRSFFIVEQSAIVHHEPSAIHSTRQPENSTAIMLQFRND